MFFVLVYQLDGLEIFQQRVDREIAEHEFIDRLFYFWDVGCYGALSFQVILKVRDY